jgi:LmbE family N-acetylglucosaminyl deacetylase
VSPLAVAATPTWLGPEPSVGRRVVVVAPHPDDEVLGTGVLLRWLAHRGVPTTIVAVTDGEASHARSHRITPAALRRVRAAEREAALAALGVDPDVVRLGLPDGAVAAHVDALAEALGPHVDAATTVVAPGRDDGHPDHVAVSTTAARAAARAGAALWEVAIWAKVHRPGEATDGALRLVADPASDAAKRAATACFRSQVHPLGPAPEDGPVVHPHELAALLAGPELVRVG